MTMTLSGHSQEVTCLDFKDGLVISGSRDQTTRVGRHLQLQFIVMHRNDGISSRPAGVDLLRAVANSDIKSVYLFPALSLIN